MAKAKQPTLISPIAIAVWPRLNEPDVKFKPEGEFRVQIILNPERSPEHAKFISDLEARYEEGYKEECAEQKKAKLKKVPLSIKPETDKDGNETGTGNVLVKFRMKHIVKNKAGETFTHRPSLADSQGRPVSPAKCRVGGGTKLRVAFQPNPFYTAGLGYGMSLLLVGVQILKLVEPSGGITFEACDAEDDGFVGEEMSAEESAALKEQPKASKGPAAKSEDGDY